MTVLKSLIWIRLIFGAVLVAIGINGYPLISRNKVAHVGYTVYAEAVKRNLSDSNPDPTWLRIEGLAKSYISSLDNLDAADRLRSLLMSGIGGAIFSLGILELILLHRSKRQ